MKDLYNAISSTFILQIKHSFARPMFKFILLLAPIFYSVITYTLFSHSTQTNFAAYAVLGTGLLTLWDSICFSSAGDIERERWSGTLQAIYNTPTKFKVLVLGKILANTILGLIPFFISFLFIRFVYGAPIIIVLLPQFFIAFIISILSFIAVAYLFSAFFTLSRSASILMNFLGAPIHILCGIVFPISILPLWTRPLSYILPPTWSAELLRMCIDGFSNWSVFYTYCTILIFETVLYVSAASFLFNIVDKNIRINANITIS